jgi:hypothetical protein
VQADSSNLRVPFETGDQQLQHIKEKLEGVQKLLQSTRDWHNLNDIGAALSGAACIVQDKIQVAAEVADLWRDLDAGQRAQHAKQLGVDVELLKGWVPKDDDPPEPEQVAQLWEPGSTATLQHLGWSPAKIAKHKALLAAAGVEVQE